MENRYLSWQPIPWEEKDWTSDGLGFRTSAAIVGTASVTLHLPATSDDMEVERCTGLSVCVQCCGNVCDTFGKRQFAVQMWACSQCCSHIATPSVPYMRMFLQGQSDKSGRAKFWPYQRVAALLSVPASRRIPSRHIFRVASSRRPGASRDGPTAFRADAHAAPAVSSAALTAAAPAAVPGAAPTTAASTPAPGPSSTT